MLSLSLSFFLVNIFCSYPLYSLYALRTLERASACACFREKTGYVGYFYVLAYLLKITIHIIIGLCSTHCFHCKHAKKDKHLIFKVKHMYYMSYWLAYSFHLEAHCRSSFIWALNFNVSSHSHCVILCACVWFHFDLYIYFMWVSKHTKLVDLLFYLNWNEPIHETVTKLMFFRGIFRCQNRFTIFQAAHFFFMSATYSLTIYSCCCCSQGSSVSLNWHFIYIN